MTARPAGGQTAFSQGEQETNHPPATVSTLGPP